MLFSCPEAEKRFGHIHFRDGRERDQPEPAQVLTEPHRFSMLGHS